MLNKLYRWSSSWTGTIIIVLAIIFFVAQAFVIPSGSMKNTLLIGDMLFVKKFSYGIPVPRIPWINTQVFPDLTGNEHLIDAKGPERGDIVVFYAPAEREKGNYIHYVKRCVAKGGDIVALKDKHLLLHPSEGNDFVKENFKNQQIVQIGEKLFVVDPYRKDHPGIHNDPSVSKDGFQPYQLFDMLPLQVPEGEYFMMGDNRDHSNDSRFWGTVPYKYIVGQPWFVYFSWDENKEIRWDRIFRSVESIEKDMEGKKLEINHKEGIY